MIGSEKLLVSAARTATAYKDVGAPREARACALYLDLTSAGTNTALSVVVQSRDAFGTLHAGNCVMVVPPTVGMYRVRLPLLSDGMRVSVVPFNANETTYALSLVWLADMGVPLTSILQLTPSVPAPSWSDVRNATQGAIVQGDLVIRDTSYHYFVFPLSAAGWKSFMIMPHIVSSRFDQILSSYLYGGVVRTLNGTTVRPDENSATLSGAYTLAANGYSYGGYQSAATLTAQSGAGWIQRINAGAEIPWLAMFLQFGTGPSTGQVDSLTIVRSTQ